MSYIAKATLTLLYLEIFAHFFSSAGTCLKVNGNSSREKADAIYVIIYFFSCQFVTRVELGKAKVGELHCLKSLNDCT